jgi:preprotein translocase subunit SecA
MEEGQEIESNMVTKAIANAQKRVEGRNFEIRKHLLDYDDVMNSQREFIYRERNEILQGENISDKVREYIREVCEMGLETYSDGGKHPDDWNMEALKGWLRTTFLYELGHDGSDPRRLSHAEFLEKIQKDLSARYELKEKDITPDAMRALERMITLQVIDTKWREHLLEMDELRDGIWAVGYSERNPLVEYKLRAFDLFNDMLGRLKQDVVEFLMKVQVKEVVQETHEFRKVGEEFHAELNQFGEGGIPFLPSQAPPPDTMREARLEGDHDTIGGVKRKKTRRSRRG